jgi:hypothetical protein
MFKKQLKKKHSKKLGKVFIFENVKAVEEL